MSVRARNGNHAIEPSRPGYEFAPPRDQAPLDLLRRPTARAAGKGSAPGNPPPG